MELIQCAVQWLMEGLVSKQIVVLCWLRSEVQKLFVIKGIYKGQITTVKTFSLCWSQSIPKCQFHKVFFFYGVNLTFINWYDDKF